MASDESLGGENRPQTDQAYPGETAAERTAKEERQKAVAVHTARQSQLDTGAHRRRHPVAATAARLLLATLTTTTPLLAACVPSESKAVSTAVAPDTIPSSAIAPTTEPPTDNLRFKSARVLSEDETASETLGDIKIGRQIMGIYEELRDGFLASHPELKPGDFSLTVIKIETTDPQKPLYYPLIGVAPGGDRTRSAILMVGTDKDGKVTATQLQNGTNTYEGKERPTLDLVIETTDPATGGLKQIRRPVFTFDEENQVIIFTPFGYEQRYETKMGYSEINFKGVTPRPIEPTEQPAAKPTATPNGVATAEPTPTPTPTPEAKSTLPPSKESINTISPDLMLGGELKLNEQGANSFYIRYLTSWFQADANGDYTKTVLGHSLEEPRSTMEQKQQEAEVLRYLREHDYKLPINDVGPNIPVAGLPGYTKFQPFINYIKDPALKEQIIKNGIDVSSISVIVFDRDNWKNDPKVSQMVNSLDGPNNLLMWGEERVYGLKVGSDGKVVLISGNKDTGGRPIYKPEAAIGGSDGVFDNVRDPLVAWAQLETLVKINQRYRNGAVACVGALDSNCKLGIQTFDLQTLAQQGVKPIFDPAR